MKVDMASHIRPCNTYIQPCRWETTCLDDEQDGCRHRDKVEAANSAYHTTDTTCKWHVDPNLTPTAK